MSAIEPIYEQALKLSEEQREVLAARLYDSIKDHCIPELTSELKSELDSRGSQMREGKVKGVKFSELRQKARNAVNR